MLLSRTLEANFSEESKRTPELGMLLHLNSTILEAGAGGLQGPAQLGQLSEILVPINQSVKG